MLKWDPWHRYHDNPTRTGLGASSERNRRGHVTCVNLESRAAPARAARFLDVQLGDNPAPATRARGCGRKLAFKSRQSIGPNLGGYAVHALPVGLGSPGLRGFVTCLESIGSTRSLAAELGFG
jgi:hypothetical protein